MEYHFLGPTEVLEGGVPVDIGSRQCTDGECDLDDLAQDAAAKGGVYQVDARIAAEAEMEFIGSIRLGQPPRTGSVLENPLQEEVHLAIAPHGKALSGTDGWRQLNGPLGNPTLW